MHREKTTQGKFNGISAIFNFISGKFNFILIKYTRVKVIPTVMLSPCGVTQIIKEAQKLQRPFPQKISLTWCLIKMFVLILFVACLA